MHHKLGVAGNIQGAVAGNGGVAVKHRLLCLVTCRVLDTICGLDLHEEVTTHIAVQACGFSVVGAGSVYDNVPLSAHKVGIGMGCGLENARIRLEVAIDNQGFRIGIVHLYAFSA